MESKNSETVPLRPPWQAAIAAGIAFAAVFLTAGGGALMPVLAVALGAAYLTGARLPNDAWVVWALRIAAIVLILATDPGPSDTALDWPFRAVVSHWIGQMCAAEMVIQTWRRQPALGKRGLAFVLLSGFVFLAGCNTFETAYVRILAPLYFLFLGLALRRFRAGDGAPDSGARRKAEALPVLMLRAGALALALVAGGVTYWVFATYLQSVNQWLNETMARVPHRATGFSTSPRLGESYDLQNSANRVLRIEGLARETHLRGASYDVYDGGRWGPAPQELGFYPADPAELAPGTRGSPARITRLADDFDLLFVPLHAAGVAPPKGGELKWAPDEGTPVRGESRPFLPYIYLITQSEREDHQGPLCRAPQRPERVRCLTVPEEIDPEVRQLARRIGGHLSNPLQRVRAVEEYLITRHSYSLTIRPGPGDPVSSFLLRKQSAHCQYFASAAVILLRCLGVPARYVQGYYAHEGAGPGVTVVRGQDAHAWAESWIDGRGWITVEATPGDGRPDQLARNVPPWQRGWEWLQDKALAAGAWLAGLRPVQRSLLAAGGALLLILYAGTHLLRRREKSPAPSFAYTAGYAGLDEVAGRFEELLRRRGLECPAHRPWAEHLAMIASDGVGVWEYGSALAPQSVAVSGGVGTASSDNERGPDRESIVTAPPRIDLSGAAAFIREYNAVRFGRPDDPESTQGLLRMLGKLEAEGW